MDIALAKLCFRLFVLVCVGIFEFVALLVPRSVPPYLFMALVWFSVPGAYWGGEVACGCALAHLALFPLLRRMVPASWKINFTEHKGVTYYRKQRLYGPDSGSGGSWGGGGSSGGGDFSGGGGSFGGGGASGSW